MVAKRYKKNLETRVWLVFKSLVSRLQIINSSGEGGDMVGRNLKCDFCGDQSILDI